MFVGGAAKLCLWVGLQNYVCGWGCKIVFVGGVSDETAVNFNLFVQ